jgi:hypothetical protein
MILISSKSFLKIVYKKIILLQMNEMLVLLVKIVLNQMD